MVRVGFTEEVAFAQSMKPAAIWRDSDPGTGTFRHKGSHRELIWGVQEIALLSFFL